MSEPTNTESPTLGDVLNKLELWRREKLNRNDVIPDDIWHDIFSLQKTCNPNKLRSLFGVTAKQYETKFSALYPNTATIPNKNDSPTTVDFCQVQTGAATPLKLKAKVTPILPNTPLLDTRTLIVEFRRADGLLMHIHTTHDSIGELLQAFLSSEVTPC
jgi:hypothetical protein